MRVVLLVQRAHRLRTNGLIPVVDPLQQELIGRERTRRPLGSLLVVISRFGDLLGTTLYDRYGGFAVCVIAITIVYALILPTLLLVPRELIATADGQMPDRAEAA